MGQVIRIPSRAACKELWEKYATPAHVRRHAEQVNRVAVALAKALIKSGISVSIECVDRASLLHDLIRVTEWKEIDLSAFSAQPTPRELHIWAQQRELYPRTMPHAVITARILEPLFPEIARIVAVHSVHSVGDLESIEQKIVYYADRRVAHTHIVSIDERMDESAQRYGYNLAEKSSQSLRKAVHAIEDELFAPLAIAPEQLIYEHEPSPTTTFATDSARP